MTQIISQTSILRRLPQTFNAEQRLALDALVFSADTVAHSIASLQELAAAHGSAIVQAPSRVRVAMFQAAWSIVDHLHVARQLLKKLVSGEYGPELGAFDALGEIATLMRNCMDHLHQKIPNLARAKGVRAPVLGSLGYVLLEREDIEIADDGKRIVGAKSIIMTTGAMLPGQSMPGVNPAGRDLTPPADLFQLSAGDQSLELSEAARRLSGVMAFLEAQCEEQIPKAAAEAAASDGRPIKDHLAHLGAGFTFVMKLKAAPDGFALEP